MQTYNQKLEIIIYNDLFQKECVICKYMFAKKFEIGKKYIFFLKGLVQNLLVSCYSFFFWTYAKKKFYKIII